MSELDLIVLRNIATNGRMFMAFVFIVNLLAFAQGYGLKFGVLAVLCVMPLGLAMLSDTFFRRSMLSDTFFSYAWGNVFGAASWIVGAMLAIVTIIQLG